MRLRDLVRRGAVALAVVLLATGCDSLGTSDGAEERSTLSSPGGPAELGAVVASGEFQVADGGDIVPLKIELYELHRRNGFVTVNVRLTRTDPAGSGKRWQIGSAFQGETISLDFSGVTLVDRKNRKRYLVARTAGADQAKNSRPNYLASSGLASVFMEAGQSVNLYAMFGAPPDDVTAVDVVVPRAPVFENVPLG